jgi:molybdopterin/thiamine biosynthesis adenylyltransferase
MNKSQAERYARHIRLPQIGESGQLKAVSRRFSTPAP